MHTFGYGNDHDAKLMSDIAELKRGYFYFVRDITTVDEAFINTLGGLMGTCA